MKFFLSLCSLFLFASSVFAQAPVRSGQPYAEASKCSQNGVILCEDFDYPSNFPCNNGTGSWINPGLRSTYNGTCSGRSIVPVSGFPAQPAGSPPGGYLKRADVANGEGMIAGCLWSDCSRTTADNPAGVTYTNGTPLSNDIYVRFQVLFSDSPAYKWPSFDNKIFFMWPNTYIDKPSANIDAGWYFGNNFFCSAINRNFNDALSFRVGDNSCGFKGYPCDNTGGCHPEHQEYCLGQGFGNSSPAISTTTPPDDTPYSGRGFRFRRGKWYNFEFRYKLSSPGVQNGTIESWIDGVKVYSDNDLATCGNGSGSCAAIAEFAQYFWYNFFQEGGGLQGYGLVDNLIISKNYIGPPTGGAPPPPDTTSPTISLTAPTSGATVSGSSVTVSADAADNVGVAGVQFKLDGLNLGAEDVSAPYSTVWNSTSASNGSHSLTATARDAAGNQATSPPVSVTVSNVPPPLPACSDTLDNDSDGLIDFPADPGCSSASDTDELNAPPPPPAQCADGLDNDADGQIDFPADVGCSSASDTDETNAPPPPPGSVIVTFDDPQPNGSSGSYLNGLFGGINWGSQKWRWEGAWLVDPTNHVYFASNSGTSRTFTFSPGPKKLVSMRVFAGLSGTLTLSDNLGQIKVVNVSNSIQTVTTNWVNQSTTVTVKYTKGWELGVDDIEYVP